MCEYTDNMQKLFQMLLGKGCVLNFSKDINIITIGNFKTNLVNTR